MTDETLFLDWPRAVASCESEGHTKGAHGCDPDAPGEFAIEIVHPLNSCKRPAPWFLAGTERHIVLMCWGATSRLRVHAAASTRCSNCGITFTLAEAFVVLGKLNDIQIGTDHA